MNPEDVEVGAVTMGRISEILKAGGGQEEIAKKVSKEIRWELMHRVQYLPLFKRPDGVREDGYLDAIDDASALIWPEHRESDVRSRDLVAYCGRCRDATLDLLEEVSVVFNGPWDGFTKDLATLKNKFDSVRPHKYEAVPGCFLCEATHGR